MKQLISLTLCALLVFAMTACSSIPEEPAQEAAEETVQETAAPPPSEEAAAPEPAKEPATSESGEKSASRGASSEGASESAVDESIVSQFQQLEYTDEELGYTVPYNIYLPEGYDDSASYPMVVFVGDATVNSNTVTTPLRERGAAVWVENQEKHPCIVLVPQYTSDLESALGTMTLDSHVWTDGLTLMSNLIFHVIDTFAVDESRVYGTGQSQGGMMTIALSDRYPDLYAAQYLVACQWDVQEMSAMADDNLWITVCEGDFKAFPGMNEAVENWESMGVSVVKYDEMWDRDADADTLDALVAEMAEQEGTIHYTVFSGGDHMSTWKFAYDIEGIRDWMFAQSK